MIHEDILNFPDTPEEYLKKQEMKGVPYKQEIYNFYEIIDALKNEVDEAKGKSGYGEWISSHHKLDKAKKLFREIDEYLYSIKPNEVDEKRNELTDRIEEIIKEIEND